MVLTMLCCLSQPVPAGDWLQFRADACHSGYTSDSLQAQLNAQWVYKPLHPPEPAWQAADTRMPFDYAPQMVSASGLVFLGSTVDGTVRALDTASGKQRWVFYTDAPVRFAPAIWKDRIFVASDDGYLYALTLASGNLLWKRYGGSHEDMVLGNGRMVSRWPVRGAPLVLDDTLYFAAGIWPSEGIFIYALDPQTGDIRWKNDSAGYLELDQPHGGARAKSGVSAQGYLAAASDTLLLPTGRAMPAAFDRDTGEFRYFHLQAQGGGWGARKGAGPFITLVESNGEYLTLNENDLFRTRDGAYQARGIPVHATVAAPNFLIFCDGTRIKALDRNNILETEERLNRKGEKEMVVVPATPVWTMDAPSAVGTALIVAGDTLVVGTQDGKVLTADLQSRTFVSALQVEGTPLALAAADGRLFVSTDRGILYCFGASQNQPPREIAQETHPSPYGKNPAFERAAQEIVADMTDLRGYCLDLGCGEGRLSYELAKRTQLHIIAVDSDAEKVARARKMLDSAGLYGSRVTVLHRDLKQTTLPNFFADLVVSGNSVKETALVVPRLEMGRLQRPYGGAYRFGAPGKMETGVREPLEGAASWTHMYFDTGNLLCSDDAIVQAPLEMLWYTDNDFEMPSRHGRGPAPLFHDGRMFVEGMHGVRAINAYNGSVLWEYPIKNILAAYNQEHLNGAATTGSNFCVNGDTVYVRHKDRCLFLDTVTGTLKAEFQAPPKADGTTGQWGYVACDGERLYGSLCDESHVTVWAFVKSEMDELYSESNLLFALDPKSGKTLWTFTPKHSVRHNTLALDAQRLYLIDRPTAERDLLASNQEKPSDELPAQPTGELIALDVQTGKPVWSVQEDIYGTMLIVSAKHDVLLMPYQDTRFKLPSELGGRMAAFRASDGTPLWNIEAAYSSRPLVNDRTIYAQPQSWDLLTGEMKKMDFKRSYGCGTLAGSTHLLAYRSATLGYWDLKEGSETIDYGGIRPGCWINTIPAGGLLLMPEASHLCTCSYLIKANVALQPMK